MRIKSFFFVVVVMLLALTETLSAQTGRTFGARKLQLDDGTTLAAGQVFLSDVGGSLGVDLNGVAGFVNGFAFPSTCALLDLSSVTKGFLTPRMSNAQELGICAGTPPEGLIVYNLTNHTLDVYNGSAWGPVSGWQLRGNFISLGSTAIGGSYIGTNTPQDFVTATNGVERNRIIGVAGATQGFMGIGTVSPNRLLEVAGASGTPSARFGSLGGVPLLAPALIATDGIVMANNAGDVNKYNTAFVVGTVGWLRTGNTILDGNSTLGTINDFPINVIQNNATVMTVGTVAQGSNVGIKTAPTANWALIVGTVVAGPNNSTLNLGNEQVNGTFNSQGNSTVGTNAGTTNTFGNIGASSNTIGNGANATNTIGSGGGATNLIGTSAANNQFGIAAALNFFGQGATTNNIGTSATTNNIGSDAAQNNIGNRTVAGVTNNVIGSSIGTVTNTITGTTATAITLDVNSIANNLRFNNIAPGSNTDAAFLDMTTIPSGNVRTRTIGSLITGSEGVEVSYVGSSADAHFASSNANVLFVSPRFINTSNQLLSITSGNPGANTVLSVNGATNAVNVNTAAYGLTTIGNGVGANTQLTVNGAIGGLVGVAPFSNGPNNGWDLYVNGDEQITGTLKIGTASIVEEGVGNTITGFNPVGLTLNTGNSGGFGDLKFQGAGVLAATVKGTGALIGSIDLPQTIAAGPGVITMAGVRYIHAFNGASNFFAGSAAGNLSLTATSSTGIGNAALTSLTSGSGSTAVGTAAGAALTSGTNNTAIGASALSSNQQGLQNTAVGSGAMQAYNAAVNGNNSAFGQNAMAASTAGLNNTAIGAFSLNSNNGSGNSALGLSAGFANNAGVNNTYIGSFSGGTNVTGGNITLVGASANVSADGFVNATAIGANATVGASNSLVLGNTALPTRVGIGINAPTTILDVRGTTNVLGVTTINTLGYNLTSIGNFSSNHQLDINGVVDAVVGDLITNGHWDLAVTGDAFVSGMMSSLNATITSLTQGSVVFAGVGGVLSQNNANFFWNNTTNRLGVGNNVPAYSVDITGTLRSTSTSDIGTTAGTTNSFGNTGATTNNIGNGAGAANNIGNGGATNIIGNNAIANTFGNMTVAGIFTNTIGNLTAAGGILTNNIGLSTGGGGIVNNNFGNITGAGGINNNTFGQAIGGGIVTNAIGSAGAVTNTILGATNINVTGGQTTQIATTTAAITNIGVLGGTNTIAGTTTINNNVNATTGINTGTSTGAVTIGNATAGSGTVTIRSNNNAAGNSIVLDVTSAATNNLQFLNIASDATPLSMLSLNASNQVRTSALSSMALEGIVFTGGAFRLGSTLTSGAGSNPFLTNRNVNLDAFNLNFTSNAGVLTPLQVIGGAAPQVNIQATHNVNTGTYALTKIGNGSSNHQLEVNGVVDALIGDALASPRWDLAVTGDIAASGIIKSGASIVIDGVSAIRRIVSDAPMTISTLGGDLTLAPASSNTQVTGNLIASSSITSSTGNIVAVTGNISATAGDITAPAGNLVVAQNVTAGLNITASAGNIVATNGKIVAGGPANAPQSTLHSYGSLGANTAAGGSTTLTVTNFFYRSTVPGATVTLAAAASCSGRIYVVKNDPSFAGGQITTVNSGGGLIDGAAAINITGPNQVMQFISDGTNWYVISNN